MALAALAQAESLALVFYDADSPHQFAVANGAREALRDLSLRYKRDIKLENFTPKAAEITPEIQAQALFEAKKSGASGAILFASHGGEKPLEDAMGKLAAEGFPVAVIGRDIDARSALAFTLRDNEKLADGLKKAFPKRSERDNFHLVFVLMGGDEAEIPEDAAAKLLPANMDIKTAKSISGGKAAKFYSCRRYGALQRKFSAEWTNWDNYGIIILDERVLADIPKFDRDSDRAFILCTQTSPLLSEYLKTSEIPLCTADDYFGYGYLSAIKLAEKIFDGKNPRKKAELLPPLKYAPEDVKKFEKDWIGFLK